MSTELIICIITIVVLGIWVIADVYFEYTACKRGLHRYEFPVPQKKGLNKYMCGRCGQVV
jgi:hypothetical protein